MKKPFIVTKYNSTKGGVDAMDQMTHRYSCKRKTQRWTLVYFFNLLDVSTIAAREVFKREFPDHSLSGPDDRGDFLRQVSWSGCQLHPPTPGEVHSATRPQSCDWKHSSAHWWKKKLPNPKQKEKLLTLQLQRREKLRKLKQRNNKCDVSFVNESKTEKPWLRAENVNASSVENTTNSFVLIAKLAVCLTVCFYYSSIKFVTMILWFLIHVDSLYACIHCAKNRVGWYITPGGFT